MALASLLMALAIVLNIFGRFIVILPVFGQLRISFTIIILIVLGFIVNPILGFICGALIDVLSFFVGATPGAFHIGFAFNAAITCSIASAFAKLSKLDQTKFDIERITGFIFSAILIFIECLLILIINPLGLAIGIMATTTILSSIISLSFLIIISVGKRRTLLKLVFLILLLNFINSSLTSLGINDLFELGYDVILGPRLIKNIIFDWGVVLLIIVPFFYIAKKKNYLGWQGIKNNDSN